MQERFGEKLSSAMRDKNYLIPLGILTLAALLRVYGLGASSLSLDEAFTLKFAQYPWPEFKPAVAEYDIHPPLYYAIAKIFRGFGESAQALRLPSLLFGISTIPLIYGIASNLIKAPDNRMVGHLSAFLFAVSAIQIGVAQNARPYALFVFSMALAIYGCTWIVRHQEIFRQPIGEWLKQRETVAGFTATILGFALLIWTHNLGLVYSAAIGAVCAGIFLFQTKINLRAFAVLAVCGVLALLFWSPNLAGFIGQLGGVSKDIWVPKPGIMQIADITASSFGIAGSTPLPRIAGGLFSIPVFAAGLIGFIRLWQKEMQWQSIFLALIIAIPMISLILVSLLFKPILILRVTYPLFIPWIILVSYGVIKFADGRAGRIFQFTIVALLTHGAVFYLAAPGKGEPWAQIVSAITEASGDNAIVFTLPNSSAMPFSYYADRQSTAIEIIPIPAAFPAAHPDYTYPSGAKGVPAINDTMIKTVENIIEQTKGKDHWIILRGYWIYDKKLSFKPMLDRHFCYAPMEIDSWYLLVFRLVPLEGASPNDCIMIEPNVFPPKEIE